MARRVKIAGLDQGIPVPKPRHRLSPPVAAQQHSLCVHTLNKHICKPSAPGALRGPRWRPLFFSENILFLASATSRPGSLPDWLFLPPCSLIFYFAITCHTSRLTSWPSNLTTLPLYRAQMAPPPKWILGHHGTSAPRSDLSQRHPCPEVNKQSYSWNIKLSQQVSPSWFL